MDSDRNPIVPADKRFGFSADAAAALLVLDRSVVVGPAVDEECKGHEVTIATEPDAPDPARLRAPEGRRAGGTASTDLAQPAIRRAACRVEHRAGGVPVVLAQRVEAPHHHATLTPFASALHLAGQAVGWLALVEEDTGRTVARACLARLPTRYRRRGFPTSAPPSPDARGAAD
ncbi:MAG: hypothetical protein ACJ789_08330 [Thermomicrobiales bacterium]